MRIARPDGETPASDRDAADGGPAADQQQDRQRRDEAGQAEGGQAGGSPADSGPEVPVLEGGDAGIDNPQPPVARSIACSAASTRPDASASAIPSSAVPE